MKIVVLFVGVGKTCVVLTDWWYWWWLQYWPIDVYCETVMTDDSSGGIGIIVIVMTSVLLLYCYSIDGTCDIIVCVGIDITVMCDVSSIIVITVIIIIDCWQYWLIGEVTWPTLCWSVTMTEWPGDYCVWWQCNIISIVAIMTMCVCVCEVCVWPNDN